MEPQGQKFQQYFCSLTVAFGAVFIGSSCAWTSPCLKFLLNENYTDPAFVIEVEEANWIAALTPLGAIFGCIPVGMMADLQGRKVTLIQTATLQICASVLATFAINILSLYIARFVLGLVMGAYCVLIPMYITEIAEKSVRGNLGSFFELLIAIGILGLYLLALCDSYIILSHSITALMLLYLLGLLLVPESPVYLMSKNRRTDAEKSLKRLRGSHYNVDGELKEMENELEDLAKQRVSYEVFTRKANIKGLSLAIMLMIFQQLSGDTVVIYFGEIIFESAEASSPTLCTVVLGTIQIFATIVSGIVVDRLGRRILLLTSGIFMAIAHTVLGYYFWLQQGKEDISTLGWLPLISLVAYIFGYGIGFGPLPWLMLGELIGSEIKRFANGIATAVCLICQTIVIFYFQTLIQSTSTSITFWLFSAACILSAIFVIFVPETKNKSLQQIQKELAGKN